MVTLIIGAVNLGGGQGAEAPRKAELGARWSLFKKKKIFYNCHVRKTRLL